VREGGRAPIGIKGERGRKAKRNGVTRRRAASGGLLLSDEVDGRLARAGGRRAGLRRGASHGHVARVVLFFHF
jgi:hypothetical protein